MPAHSVKTVQRIPASLDDVWELFSNHRNLLRLTPDTMRFRIISPDSGDYIYTGQVIEYTVSPVLGIPLYWKTEIEEVKNREFFIDVQRKGPYRLWRHEHYFKEIEGGVEMTDIIHYKNPLGFTGRLVNRLLVKRKLRQLFEYRFYKVAEILGTWKDQRPEILFN